MEHTLPTSEEVTEVLTTADEDLLSVLETDEERKVAAKILPGLAAKANSLAEATKAKELKREVEQLTEENRKYIQAELDKIRKANEPLSPEELTKLLSQEYVEFPVQVRIARNGTGVRDFVIRELPVAVERKVLTTIQKTLAPRLKELSSLDWSAEATNLSKLNKMVSMIPGALDTLAECTAICLNPYDEHSDVNGEWVMNNLNVYKMYNVLQAQANASRWRDFFLAVYQAIPGQMTV